MTVSMSAKLSYTGAGCPIFSGGNFHDYFADHYRTFLRQKRIIRVLDANKSPRKLYVPPSSLLGVVNMGGIELGSSDKHTQNHTYTRIARNPELRGIRGGSLRQLNPAHQNDFPSWVTMGGKHALRSSDPVQTLFRPCSDMH